MSRIDFSRWGTATAPAHDGRADGPTGGVPDALARCRVDIWAGDDPPVPFLFRFEDGSGIMARGNLQVVKGREKTGKSAFGVVLITAAQGGGFLGVSPVEETRVLWLDTEQDCNTLRKRARKAVAMAQVEPGSERMAVYTLKGDSPAERLKKALAAMRQEKADFVFLDGLADLCEDFNDNKECAAVVGALASVAEELWCAVLCVIHTNKRDDEARGHLGTIAQQKASEVYEMKRAGSTATVTQALTRFAGAPDVVFEFGEDFSLLHAYGGLSAEEARRRDMQNDFAALFAGQEEWRYTPLCEAYAKLKGVSFSQAQKVVKRAKDEGVLQQDEKKRYHLAARVLFGTQNEGDYDSKN